MSENPLGQAEFEAMLRRYAAKLGARYAPVLLTGLLLMVVVVLVPTTEPESASTSFGVGTGPAGSGSEAAQGEAIATPGSDNDAAAPPGGGADAAGGGAASGSEQGGAPGGGASGGPTPAPGAAPAAAGGAPGTAKTGVTCGPDARQYAWSGKSPLCAPAFRGDNGGATGQGVTDKTITLTFRVPSSAQDEAIQAAVGDANVNYDAMVADMQTYTKFFNSQFELYGRQVVLKAFPAQGDYIQEHQGQNLAGAQADAVTARELGSFGDVSFPLSSSQAYQESLAEEGVMSFSSIAQPQSWFEKYAPYQWSAGSSGNVAVQTAAELVCRRVAGMPAIFAGDASLRVGNRKFGMIYPETPNYASLARQYRDLLKQRCGQGLERVTGYKIDVSQFPSQAASIIAQMRAANVTTILCACDPVFPVFLTRAASGQLYHPEWLSALAGDPVARLYDQQQWKSAFGAGVQFPDPKSTEAYRVYKLANPSGEPAEGSRGGGPPYFYVPYYTLLHVFMGLQAAGPNLSPGTFQQGMFSLPPSTGNDSVGSQWVFGKNIYAPASSFSLVWWDPKGKSKFDGGTGMYAACDGGKEYSIYDLKALGGPKKQLGCFGK